MNDSASQTRFPILIYNPDMKAVNKIKDGLLSSGYFEIFHETKGEAIRDKIRDINPQVIITDNWSRGTLNALSFMKELRKSNNSTVVFVGDKLEENANLLLTFKKTYMISIKDGLHSLIDIITRIKSKTESPGQWI